MQPSDEHATARPAPRARAAVRIAGLLALFPLALPGCAVDEAEEVAIYRSVLDANVREASYAPGGPLTLETALLLANAHNERIAISGENYLQALIDKDRAAAAFFPTVSLI